MKKLLSLLLVLFIAFSLCFVLSSCGDEITADNDDVDASDKKKDDDDDDDGDDTEPVHTCSFVATDWEKDAEFHWHACTGKDCTEISDKAEHTYNDGEITIPATQDDNGVKVYTCRVCLQTKTEDVVFTGLTKTEWDAAFDSSVFENFTYTESVIVTGQGVNNTGVSIYKFTKDSAWVKSTVNGESNEAYAPDKDSANELCDQLVASIVAITDYNNFEYDSSTKTYKAKDYVFIAALNSSTKDVALSFDDGKLVEINYTTSYTVEGVNLIVKSKVTLTDYGTVVLPLN